MLSLPNPILVCTQIWGKKVFWNEISYRLCLIEQEDSFWIMTTIMEAHLNIIKHLYNFFAWLACLWCLVLDIYNHFLIQRCAFCWRRLPHLLPSYFGLLQKELSTFTFHTYGLWMFFLTKNGFGPFWLSQKHYWGHIIWRPLIPFAHLRQITAVLF